MKPYYQDDRCTIYHGDCREVLPTLGRFDLVLTDPPYGISDKPMQTTDADGLRRAKQCATRAGRANDWHPISDWDKTLVLPDIDAEVIAWFGHWRKREQVAKKYGRCRCEIIWCKDVHVGPPCPVAMQDERLWVFGDDFTPRKFETSVWQVPIIPTFAYRRHRNEKPEALLKRALLWLPGETVLDPFMGSGTTLRAAKDLGRQVTGIEINERYCEISANRLSQGVLF